MEEIYFVMNTIDVLPNKIELIKDRIVDEYFSRIEKYVKRRIENYGFEVKNTKYRFYILEKFRKIEPNFVLSPNVESFKYYELDELLPRTESSLESTIITQSKEGRKIEYYTVRYERDSKNREEAIRTHGTECMVCGCDFEKIYGKLGSGYIEVHHIKPLFSLEEVININPQTDLVCLCANCHRMIHRKRNDILTVEELKVIVNHNSRGEV